MRKQFHKTSWEHESRWYQSITGGRGHYFHEHVVLPGVLRLLNLSPNSAILDLACGSGVLGRRIGKTVRYTGIDSSSSLIEAAKKEDRSPQHEYIVGDVSKPLSIPKQFTHATIILALQNIKNSTDVIKYVSEKLLPESVLVIVLNHPCFRIPRQSSWGTDETNKLQYRRINRYLSPLEIPITMHPGQSIGSVTWSYHLPLSAYATMLHATGFVIDTMEEWASDKMSVGKYGKMENRSRAEIPLFLTIKALKEGVPKPNAS